MSFIPGFEYDIFISYAHVDNIILPGQTDSWIEQFHKYLNMLLAQRSGHLDTVKIWWDNKKLDGNILFNQSIEEGIKKSAVLICLNSSGYVKSDYCKQELSLFYDKARSESIGLKVGNRSRIINVLLNNIPFKGWPEPMSGATGFPFHDAKESGDIGDPVSVTSAEFMIQMQNLRDAVWTLLNDFGKAQKESHQTDKEDLINSKEGFTIYIGEVSDTLRIPRKRVITELEKKGFKVVTGIPPPHEVSAHEQAAMRSLKNADLAIQLLDRYPGPEIVGDAGTCYPQRQAEIAFTLPNPQMIWVPAEIDFEIVEDEKYKSFLEDLENGKASTKTYEFVRGANGTLAQQIIDFAEQLKVQQTKPKTKQGELSVLLDTHFNDTQYAIALSNALQENQIRSFINPQEDDPHTNMNVLDERISQVSKLIFLYGSSSKDWVLERMSAALSLIVAKEYPVEDIFIYMAPPHKEAKDISIKQRYLKVNIIDGSNSTGLDKMWLQQFLNDLKTAAA